MEAGDESCLAGTVVLTTFLLPCLFIQEHPGLTSAKVAIDQTKQDHVLRDECSFHVISLNVKN